jgi:hypothetical protein
MVSAVHYFATLGDHAAILDYLGEPVEVTLHRWPVVHTPAERGRGNGLSRLAT